MACPANPNGAEVKITARPLPGAGGEPREMKVSFPGEANTLFPDAAVIHSIGKIDGNLLLFYGDANRAHDADLRDESVLVISVDDPDRKTNRLVFAAAAAEDENGKTRWRSTHVRRVLPASAPGRVYALTEGPHGVAVLGSDAKPIDTHSDALFATEYRDGRETYDLNVKSAQNKAVMEVARRGTDTRLSYELPWRWEGAPLSPPSPTKGVVSSLPIPTAIFFSSTSQNRHRARGIFSRPAIEGLFNLASAHRAAASTKPIYDIKLR